MANHFTDQPNPKHNKGSAMMTSDGAADTAANSTPTEAVPSVQGEEEGVATPAMSAAGRVPSKEWKLYGVDFLKKARGKVYHRGFINNGYLNGFVNRIESNIIWVQLSNKAENSIPIFARPEHNIRAKIRERQPVSLAYDAEARPISDIKAAGFSAVLRLREINQVNVLALPLSSAFQKRIASNQPSSEFQPYGSGQRLGGDPNRAFLAGIIVGRKTVNRRVYDEEMGCEVVRPEYSEILIRQDDSPTNRIPIRVYRSAHQEIAAQAKIGDPVYVEPEARIQWVRSFDRVTGQPIVRDGKEVLTAVVFFIADALRVPTADQIVYLPDEESLPDWAKEVRAEAVSRRRVGQDISREASARRKSKGDTAGAGLDSEPAAGTITLDAWVALPDAASQYAMITRIDGVSAVEALQHVTPERGAAIRDEHEKVSRT